MRELLLERKPLELREAIDLAETRQDHLNVEQGLLAGLAQLLLLVGRAA